MSAIVETLDFLFICLPQKRFMQTLQTMASLSLEHTSGTTMITDTTLRLYFSTKISHLFFHMVIPCQNGMMLTESASGGSIYYHGPCVYYKTEGHRNFTNQSYLNGVIIP